MRRTIALNVAAAFAASFGTATPASMSTTAPGMVFSRLAAASISFTTVLKLQAPTVAGAAGRAERRGPGTKL